MIQLLAEKYNKQAAYVLFLVFAFTLNPGLGKTYAADRELTDMHFQGIPSGKRFRGAREAKSRTAGKAVPSRPNAANNNRSDDEKGSKAVASTGVIGGPNQPEMASFKSAGANNMVNLFTGDFSYNIPLMDAGGYPINLFYDGGITMEQEASWVGLGWNINPGTINRNVRGIPDDFNGEDLLTQTMDMKPNETWGASVSFDPELFGIKKLKGEVSLGVSVNNYLGPSLELGYGVSFDVAEKALGEKNALSVKAGVDANLSSRSGLTVTPNVSLMATSHREDGLLGAGIGLSTSYNSRSGIKALNVNEQVSFNANTEAAMAGVVDQTGDRRFVSSAPITFARPSYVPALRAKMTNTAFAGRFQLGTGIGGGYVSAGAQAYLQKSEIKPADRVQSRPMVGYLYYQKGSKDPNAVMDFTRFNDGEVTPHTPVIAPAQYSYDVFNIQGEGTGGSIRAYRNDYGYVRDNISRTSDESLSAGVDVGPPGHFGGNFNTVTTPSVVREWMNGNKLRSEIGFSENNGLEEHVYFRNPGETSVVDEGQFDGIGGTDLVRFKLGGSKTNPTIEPVLERFAGSKVPIGTVGMSALSPGRKKRTQIISFLTASEAGDIGLDNVIKDYWPGLGDDNTLKYTGINRVSEDHKAHHISEIDVTEANGRRYVYGIPVYNLRQRDYTFSVTGKGNEQDEVSITGSEPNTLNTAKDGFLQITETPAYAQSFLLSGILSPDYVDVTGNGISEDDIGDAVKFNYSYCGIHKWRTPAKGMTAHFNDGNLSETKDDKGIISYGERESWYLHSVESKTMIALFTLEDRDDGKGVAGAQDGGINTQDKSVKRLKQIDLYSKADLRKNGLDGATSIKTVHFKYSYTLCAGTQDNPSSGGKLTLDSIYFTFNGKEKARNSKYVFSYGSGATANPGYQAASSDRWGHYKPASDNPDGIRNSFYPYAVQEKQTADDNAQAWLLKKILLPSGGQIEVGYESDDYAFVQNRRASDMMSIAGFAKDAGSAPVNRLYNSLSSGVYTENNFVFVSVSGTVATAEEVYEKYLEGQELLAFKIMVNMPKGPEYVTSYAHVKSWGRADDHTIWLELKKVNAGGQLVSPLSLTALEFLREHLPGQAFPAYDVSDSRGFKQVSAMVNGLLSNLKNAFMQPISELRSRGAAKTVVLGSSFVRLNDPDGYKYGGGHRVKSVVMKDNWDVMTQQYASVYGQTYDYSTTENFHGTERTISSGVASYEPVIGGEENPFQNIVQYSDKLPLGPASYGAVEMPVLDAFFPAPLVGYSKVTVRAFKPADLAGKKTYSGVGKQVTEFYTAKDFPVYYSHTAFDAASDLQDHEASAFNFFWKYSFDSRALSQGFLVATNDMHGKMKSQSSYAENDTTTRIGYTENFYRNTGASGLDEKFDFVFASQGGVVKEGNMGIDMELMIDTREFLQKATSYEVQGQADLIPVILPLWAPTIWPVSASSENVYRAVTATKVINYHGVLDSVIVMDKGSVVSTKNLVYDAETGAVVVNRTNNEFDDPVYSVNYPAYWAYSGMGTAYKNIDAVYSGVSFYDGRITGGMTSTEIKNSFESGDELYVMEPGGGSSGCVPASGETKKIWVFNQNKNVSSLTDVNPAFVFMDAAGHLFTNSNVGFRIVRSGKRNMLDAVAAQITTMSVPIKTVNGEDKLLVSAEDNVINGGAAEYREKWQADDEVFKKYKMVYNPNTCAYDTMEDCGGDYEDAINPYMKGLLGNFRAGVNLVYYGARRAAGDLNNTNLRRDGYINGFAPYWGFNSLGNLVPDAANTWVWKDRTTRFNKRGMQTETKNALGVYASASYGYDKSLAVSIAQNSKYKQMFYEGFEENGYDEYLGDSPGLKCDKGLALPGIVVNTENAGFKAHSGKFVMGVPVGTEEVSLSTAQNDAEDFSLIMYTKNPDVLVNTGGNIVSTTADGEILTNLSGVTELTGQDGMDLNVGHILLPTDYHYISCDPQSGDIQLSDASGGYTVVESHYFEVPADGRYTLGFGINELPYGTGDHGATTYSDISFDGQSLQIYAQWYDDQQKVCAYQSNNELTLIKNENVSMQIRIDDANGRPFQFGTAEPFSSTLNSNNKSTMSLCLPKGVYKVVTTNSVSFSINNSTSSSGMIPPERFTLTVASESTPGVFLPIYKDLTSENTCSFTEPISGSVAMTNSEIVLEPGTKMLFSSWARESQVQENGFLNTRVELYFGAGRVENVSIAPAGPVIEGWQKIEGEFTVPNDVPVAVLKFVNSGSETVYFDDIRIHPFKANMKSYVYDPVSLRLVAELDANNYATYYEYDDEGVLIRTKAETAEGIKTLNETRSYQQNGIREVQ